MRLIVGLILLLSMLPSYAAKKTPSFTGPDFTGVYDCKGLDAHEGAYEGKVTLKLKKEHSQAQYASYDFLLEVPGFGKYPGHMVANGLNAAMYFALEDQSNHDFGTGVSEFSKNAKGQWQFHKFYFEPKFKGGNTGFEDCVKQ
ncbi:MAG: hypothetical protein EXR41_04660 [Candidatus Methylopumilus sp.]|nr:hypothetical protein [Candidatus Methylopumilus sp.]